MITALLDLGTNTFNLKVVEHIHSTSFKTRYNKSFPVTLGEGGIGKGYITEAAFNRGIQAVIQMHEVMQKYAIDHIISLATSAIRSASNGPAFLKEIENKTGIHIVPISGDQEAAFIFKGVIATVDFDGPIWVMDIGGGSVEFIAGNKTKIFWKQSFDLGAARLRERFHTTDPMSTETLIEMDFWLQEQLAPLKQAAFNFPTPILVGAAGSFETIAKLMTLKMDTDKALFLNKQQVDSWIEKILPMPRQARADLGKLSEYRIDMFPSAMQLLKTSMKILSTQEIWVSPWSVKEGALLESL